MKENKVTNESGFSLMELMVASAIFLVVMAAVFGVLQIGKISRDTINNSSETLNNARMSINAAGRDAINAGLGYSRVGGIVPDDLANSLLQLPQDTGNSRDVFTAVMAGDEINSSVLSLSGEKNDVVAFMFRDLEFNSGDPVIITGVSTANDRVDLHAASGDCASCSQYDLYLVESGNGNHALAMATQIRDSNSTIRVQTGDPLQLNRATRHGLS